MTSLAASRLEYAHAFDLMEWPSEGSLLAVVSTPEFVDLTLARTVIPVTFVCEGPETLAHARRRLEQGYLPEALVARCSAYAVGEPDKGAVTDRGYDTALWAAPQSGTWSATLARIETLLRPEGVLSALTETRIGAALRKFRRDVQAGETGVLSGDFVRHVRRVRWDLEGTVRLGGAATAWWAVASRLMALAGRPDLADRAEQAHHRAVANARGASFEVVRARLTGGKR